MERMNREACQHDLHELVLWIYLELQIDKMIFNQPTWLDPNYLQASVPHHHLGWGDSHIKFLDVNC